MDHKAGALQLLRSFENQKRVKKWDLGNVMRGCLPTQLQAQYKWRGAPNVAQEGAEFEEVLTASNMYPGVFNDKGLTRAALFFLVAKFIFIFATTGKPVANNEEGQALVKVVKAIPQKFITMHLDLLRVMQDPKNVCVELWKARVLLYVSEYDAAVAAAKACVEDKNLATAKQSWKIAGYVACLLIICLCCLHGRTVTHRVTVEEDESAAGAAMLGLASLGSGAAGAVEALGGGGADDSIDVDVPAVEGAADYCVDKVAQEVRASALKAAKEHPDIKLFASTWQSMWQQLSSGAGKGIAKLGLFDLPYIQADEPADGDLKNFRALIDHVTNPNNPKQPHCAA